MTNLIFTFEIGPVVNKTYIYFFPEVKDFGNKIFLVDVTDPFWNDLK